MAWKGVGSAKKKEEMLIFRGSGEEDERKGHKRFLGLSDNLNLSVGIQAQIDNLGIN